MITAHDVAIELRKLADTLDKNPSAVLPQVILYFYCGTKDQFINSAGFVTRPLEKSEDSGESTWKRIRLTSNTNALRIQASVQKSLTCELVEPAKPAVYRCIPILSAIEEAALETK